METCNGHLDHLNRIERNEKDIVDVRTDVKDLRVQRDQMMDRFDGSLRRVHERIDSMKNWVVAGMGALIIEAVGFIAGIIMYLINTKGAAS